MRARHAMSFLVLVLVGGGLWAAREAAGGAAMAAPMRAGEEGMAKAARGLLESLGPELRADAAAPFETPARTDWHYVPRVRPGVSLARMSEPQRMAARNLLRAALSSRGMLKAETIMSLDQVLREMAISAGGTGEGRDPLAYAFQVFGQPPGDGTGSPRPWGWKVEGHHLSLNFTLTPDGAGGWRAAVTPSFFGANPAEVRVGPRAGLRALAAEEDLGRELVTSLDAGQREKAILPVEAPGDVLTSPGRNLDVATAEGLAASEMTAAQRGVLERLLSEYAGSLRFDLAEKELARIRSGGGVDRLGAIRFAWAGSVEPGRPHYYRISGATFVIEYDNTQNDANHVHTVWHDRERDFGRDVLKEHVGEHGDGK